VVIATGIFSVGCFSNKNREVVENAPAPPPSAYPSGPGSDANGANGATGTAESAPGGGSPYGATVAASAPEPFVLREGEQLITHLIVSGDSLSSIAGKYNSSISRIQAANGMKDTKIFAGKTLQVPTSAPPSDLAMNSPSAGYSTPSYGATISPGAGYPAPAAALVPASSYSSEGIAAPPVPVGALNSGSAPLPAPGNPASTSYTREVTVPAPSPPAGGYPVPSFESSRIQFGQ
jgi:LysM repeat protein